MRREFSVLAEGRHIFGRRPKPRAGHYKDLTETGNHARKVSGTQGRVREIRSKICSLPDYLGELTALYFDSKIFIGWILFRTMPPGNLVNLILVAIVMSERQTSPRWGWIIHSGNKTSFIPPYCFLTLAHNALQAQATQYTITTRPMLLDK